VGSIPLVEKEVRKKCKGRKQHDKKKRFEQKNQTGCTRRVGGLERALNPFWRTKRVV